MNDAEEDLEYESDIISLSFDDCGNGDVVDLASSSDDDDTEEPGLAPTSSYGNRSFCLPVTFFDISRNVERLKKCRPLCIKLIDCGKRPSYYKNILRARKSHGGVICKELDSKLNDDNKKPKKAVAKDNVVSVNDKIKSRTDDVLTGTVESKAENNQEQSKKNKSCTAYSFNCKKSTECEVRIPGPKSRMDIDEKMEYVKQQAIRCKDLSQVNFKRNKGLVGLTISKKDFDKTVTNENKIYSADKKSKKETVNEELLKDIGRTLYNLGTYALPLSDNNNVDIAKKDCSDGHINKEPKHLSLKSCDIKDQIEKNIKDSPTRCSLKITCSKIFERAIKLKEAKVRDSKETSKTKSTQNINQGAVLIIAKDKAVPKLNLKRKQTEMKEFKMFNPNIEQSHHYSPSIKTTSSEKIQKEDVPVKNKTKKNDLGASDVRIVPLNAVIGKISQLKLKQSTSLATTPNHNQKQESKSKQKKLQPNKDAKHKKNKNKPITECPRVSLNEQFNSNIKSSTVARKPNELATSWSKCQTNLSSGTKKNVSNCKTMDKNTVTKDTNRSKTRLVQRTPLNFARIGDGVSQPEENCVERQMQYKSPLSPPYPANENYITLNRPLKPKYSWSNPITSTSSPPRLQTSMQQNHGYPIPTVVNRCPLYYPRPIEETSLRFIEPYPPPNTNVARILPQIRETNDFISNFRMPLAYTNMGHAMYPSYLQPPIPGYHFLAQPPFASQQKEENQVPDASIIGSNADGQLIKKITIMAAAPLNTAVMNDKEKMLTALNSAIVEREKSPDISTEQRFTPKKTEADLAPTAKSKCSKPGPLSKKSINSSDKHTVHDKSMETSIKQPCKGYSPPILPIPSYQQAFEILVKNDQKKADILKNKESITNNKQLHNNTLKRKLLTAENENKEKIKKISIEQYKKKALKDDKNLSKDFKSKYDDNNQDLGYDSDATCVL